MQILARSATVAALLTSFAALAAPPADAPTGTTGKCKDGSYSSVIQQRDACKGHKGVGDWYGRGDGAAPAVAKVPASPPTSTLDTDDVTPSSRSVAATKGKTGVPTAKKASAP